MKDIIVKNTVVYLMCSGSNDLEEKPAPKKKFPH